MPGALCPMGHPMFELPLGLHSVILVYHERSLEDLDLPLFDLCIDIEKPILVLFREILPEVDSSALLPEEGRACDH